MAGGQQGPCLKGLTILKGAQLYQKAWGIPTGQAHNPGLKADPRLKAVSNFWLPLSSRKEQKTRPAQRPTELARASEKQSRLLGEVLPLPAPLSRAMETFMRAGK